MYWKDKLYVMWIDSDQSVRITHSMLNDDSFLNGFVTAKHSSEYWVEAQRKFMIHHNVRIGETKISYNSYHWRRELIFNTEQDAILFALKVL
jgi:hypothetical protein